MGAHLGRLDPASSREWVTLLRDTLRIDRFSCQMELLVAYRGCDRVPVTAASLGAALVIVIAVSMVMVIKLQKDKINMAELIKSMTVQSSSGTSAVKRDVNRDYENVEICDQKAAIKIVTDIEVNENPAYSRFVN